MRLEVISVELAAETYERVGRGERENKRERRGESVKGEKRDREYVERLE